MLLDFVQHIVKSSSLMFANPACQPAEYPHTIQSCIGTDYLENKTKTTNSDQLIHCFLYLSICFSSDFSKWVVVRLLRVGASPGCDVIHGRVSAVLCSLLHSLRVRVPYIFSCLVREFILMAQDLSNVLYAHIAALCGPDVHTQNQWPVKLERFPFSATRASYLTQTPLVLSSPAALESLTAVALGITTDSLRGVVSCRDLSAAWETACSILANGNTRLRKISMAMLRKLVELRKFDETQSHNFFAAFFHLLETHDFSDEKEPYEGELLKLTRCLFQSAHVSHSDFESVYLSQMFECVCAFAGAGVKFGSELTESLCVLFSFSLSVVPSYEGAYLLRRQQVADVCRTLARTVGTENQSEVLTFFSITFAVFASCFLHLLCALQCAEGFLQAALKAEKATVMQKTGDGETPAKRSCKSANRLVTKTTKTSPMRFKKNIFWSVSATDS